MDIGNSKTCLGIQFHNAKRSCDDRGRVSTVRLQQHPRFLILHKEDHTHRSNSDQALWSPHGVSARRVARVAPVRTSSEFWEPSSRWFITDDRQSSPIQMVKNLRFNAIPHRRTGAARRTAHAGACKGAGAAHRTKPESDPVTLSQLLFSKVN